MEQVISGGYYNLLNPSSTEYNTLASGYLWDGALGRNNKIISTDGTLKNLYIKLSAAPGASKQYEFTVMLNGSATDLSVIIADANTTGNNTSDEIVVTGGDKVELRCDPTDTPATGTAAWSVMFSGDVDAESLILGGGNGANNTSETRYAQISGGIANWGTTEVNHTQIIPTDGTIKNFYVELQNVPDTGGSDGYRFTVRIGAASPANGLVVEITGDDLTGNDLVNTISVSAGDRVTVMCEPIGTPAASARTFMGATFLADVDGESIVLGGSSDTLNSSTTEYHNVLPWTNDTWSATEASKVQLGQLCVITKLYVDLSAAPGADGDKYTFTLRVAGADTNVVTEVQDADTTGNSGSLADSVANGENMGVQSVPDVTPSTPVAYWGFVSYIPPPITYTADTVITAVDKTKTYTVDTAIEDEDKTKTYTADTAIKAFDKTKTYIVDALIKAINKTKTYLTDLAIEDEDKAKTYTSDVAIEDEDKTKTYTTDVAIEDEDKTKTYTIDLAIEDDDKSTIYTVDVLIKSVDNAKTYTTDVVLITLEYRYFTVHLPKTTQTITLPQTTQTVHLRGKPS